MCLSIDMRWRFIANYIRRKQGKLHGCGFRNEIHYLPLCTVESVSILVSTGVTHFTHCRHIELYYPTTHGLCTLPSWVQTWNFSSMARDTSSLSGSVYWSSFITACTYENAWCCMGIEEWENDSMEVRKYQRVRV